LGFKNARNRSRFERMAEKMQYALKRMNIAEYFIKKRQFLTFAMSIIFQ